MFTDTHFHLDDFGANGEIEAIVARASEAGVNRMVAIGGRDSANRLSVSTARSYPGALFATVGYDRDVAEGWDGDDSKVRELAALPEVVAIGESGLDYHYSADSATEQCLLFESMLQIAADVAKPIVIHSREADEDTLRLVRGLREQWRDAARPCGILHCFTGNLAFMEACIELGLMISFSGIVSFRNADALREVAREVPKDRLLIETDSPYLAPVPHRGKRNEPAYVPAVAASLSETLGVSIDYLAELSTKNAEITFGWQK